MCICGQGRVLLGGPLRLGQGLADPLLDGLQLFLCTYVGRVQSSWVESIDSKYG